MHRISAIALLALGSSALAASPVDKYTGSIGSTSLGGQVDVPLYTTANGLTIPCVKVSIGDNEYLMALASGVDIVYFGADMVKAEGWKAKDGNAKLINIFGESNKYKTGGKKSWTTAPELSIGGLVLSDVVGLTADPSKPSGPESISPMVDGIIGLSALPEDIVWSIRASTGEVSFAHSGESGEALKAAIDGTVLSTHSVESTNYKYGKRKSWRPYIGLIVAGSVGDQAVDVHIQTSTTGSGLSSAVELTDGVSSKLGDKNFRHLPVALGDMDMGRGWFYHTSTYTHAQFEHQADLGMHHLSDIDMVVDPAAKTVELAQVKGQSRHDPMPFLLARAEAATQDAPGEDGEDEASTESEDTPSGSAKAWSTLADLQERTGDFAAAIASRTQATAFDEDSCTEWMGLGKTQLGAGKIGDAIVNLETASKAYHAWYDLSLEVREEISKKQDKMDKDDKLAAEDKPAAAACHEADGYLAAALFSAGDMDTIESLYTQHLDLDPKLAMVTANARMVKGDFAGANAPLRQAVKLRREPWDAVRTGLAQTYAKAGDWETADGHYRRALQGSQDHRVVQMWLDGTQSAKGAAAAVSAAQDNVKARPESAGAHFGLLHAAIASGDEESISGATAIADVFFSRHIEVNPKSAELWSVYARTLVMMGRADEARQAGELALQLDPTQAAAWLAMSDVESAAGNADRAAAHKLRAAQVAPFHPGYALLIEL
jgi:tetratricopeptide (TPR) repeat protein